MTDGWQAAVFSEKQGYSVDEPVRVKLLARNESGKPLIVWVGVPDWRVMANFKVVRVADGEAVEIRPYHNEFERLERSAGSSRHSTVEPGGTISPGLVNLRTFFDLTPGTYRVTANCQLPSPEAKDLKKSLVSIPTNSITITIIPKY
jgi:hypothetical protein